MVGRARGTPAPGAGGGQRGAGGGRRAGWRAGQAGRAAGARLTAGQQREQGEREERLHLGARWAGASRGGAWPGRGTGGGGGARAARGGARGGAGAGSAGAGGRWPERFGGSRAPTGARGGGGAASWGWGGASGTRHPRPGARDTRHTGRVHGTGSQPIPFGGPLTGGGAGSAGRATVGLRTGPIARDKIGMGWRNRMDAILRAPGP
jgi:hypothetical protein